MTANLAHSRFGRALVALRDAEVAAEAVGISKPALLRAVFLFSGGLAGIAGGLFATLQSYITPEAFTFDLSVLFFIAILIGGRGSILGPLLGTVLLTVLPEIAAPLVAWSTFLYAAMLLLIVVAAPGGIAQLLRRRDRAPLGADRAIQPRPALLGAILDRPAHGKALALAAVSMRFGGVRALDGLDLIILPGEVHGLIGPNGSGKTTALNVFSGFYAPQLGRVELGGAPLPPGDPASRARLHIARTFQTPRLIGEATVIDNVMVGGSLQGCAHFAEAALSLQRHRADERLLRHRAREALQAIGLRAVAEVRADRLQHTELRIVEIARALMLRPQFLLLDEPGAGLSAAELSELGRLIRAIALCGTGVLVVEHHADLIFDICDRVTVLDLGHELASGTPDEIRAHREVVGAYLGS
jgi:ABC-type branched-subunit amino acid transport system ATPase component